MSIMSCITYFEGTFICMCGKLTRPRQRCDESDQKEAFEAPEAPFYRTSIDLSQEIVDAVRTRDSNITTRLETYCGVLQKVKRHLPRSGTDGNMMRSARNLSFLTDWLDARVKYLDHIVHFEHQPQCTVNCREKDM